MLTCQGATGYALVGPSPANITVVSRKPNLPEIRLQVILRRLFPQRRGEWRTSLIQRQSLKGILDSVREGSIVPSECAKTVSIGLVVRRAGHLFFVGGIDPYPLEPSNPWNTEASHCVPYADGFDLDEVAIVLVDTGVAHLLQPRPVFVCGARTHRLVGERVVGERVMVVTGLPVLHVFEDGIELVQTLPSQQAKV